MRLWLISHWVASTMVPGSNTHRILMKEAVSPDFSWAQCLMIRVIHRFHNLKSRGHRSWIRAFLKLSKKRHRKCITIYLLTS